MSHEAALSGSCSSPLVTVGIPVYNGEPFLGETLEAHLAQTYRSFEIVISDNGSTDRTEEICRHFAFLDDRIRYYRSEQNRGAAWNFNRTLELANGELFKWSAADDVCAPTLLARCVQSLEEDPGAVLAHPRSAVIDATGHVLYQFEDIVELGPWPRQPRERVGRLMTAVFTSGLAAVATVHGVVRTSVLRSTKPFGSYFGSDFAVVTELATRGAFVEVPELLAFFRRHPGSSSGYTRAPSARQMQQFFTGGAQHTLAEQFNLRRRYVEVTRRLLAAPISPMDRTRLLALEAHLLGRRVLWRLRFELSRGEASSPVSTPGPHWSEFHAVGTHWADRAPSGADLAAKPVDAWGQPRMR